MFSLKKINFLVTVFISATLIIFDIYKAINASFTFDESVTYLNYVNDSFINIISYYDPFPNNHILNTLLMKLSQALFGTSELMLRLPNILAHVLYLIFSFKIFDRYNAKNTVLFFILMNVNPFLLDFFSLARGYGIAIGLMTSAFYFYCRFLEDQKPKYHALSLFFISLASLANFGLLNVFLVFILVHNLFQFFIFKRRFSLKNIWLVNYSNLIFLSFLVAVCYEPIRKITQLKMLNFGGTNGFWEDTIGSLLAGFNYYSSYGDVLAIICKAFIILVSVLFFIKFALYVFRKKAIDLTQKIVLFFGLVLFLLVLSSVLQHMLFNTVFLVSRFALFLYPIFILMCCFLMADMFKSLYKYVTRVFLVLITFLFFSHTTYSINVSWYYEWQYDMYTKNVVEELCQLKQNKSFSRVTIGSSYLLGPTIRFYKKIWKLDWLSRVDKNEAKDKNDYCYLTEDDFNKIPRKEITRIIEIVKHYQPINNYLVKCNLPKVSMQIKASNNKYVCANRALGNIIIANSDHGWDWETFSMIYLEKDKMALYSSELNFFSAELGHNTALTATRSIIGEWETFTLIKLSSDSVAFKASNGKYLSVDEKTLQIFAKADSIGKKEKFKIEIMKAQD